MSEYILRSARYLASECISQAVREGDTVVDATMGNGHDTEMLARLVGEKGHVYAFDIQHQAVENTRARLTEQGLIGRVTLIEDSHANLARYVTESPQVIMFNLGWLPGGDKQVTTLLSSTLTAVQTALSLLPVNGVLCMCVYPGHDEGMRELKALTQYFTELDPRQFNCLLQTFLNAGDGAPRCFIIQKQPGAKANG